MNFTTWRFSVSFYDPRQQWCFGLHSCNHNFMFEFPGGNLSFYFGKKFTDG